MNKFFRTLSYILSRYGLTFRIDYNDSKIYPYFAFEISTRTFEKNSLIFDLYNSEESDLRINFTIDDEKPAKINIENFIYWFFENYGGKNIFLKLRNFKNASNSFKTPDLVEVIKLPDLLEVEINEIINGERKNKK